LFFQKPLNKPPSGAGASGPSSGAGASGPSSGAVTSGPSGAGTSGPSGVGTSRAVDPDAIDLVDRASSSGLEALFHHAGGSVGLL